MKVYILMSLTESAGDYNQDGIWRFEGAYATRQLAEDNRSWTWLDWSIEEADVDISVTEAAKENLVSDLLHTLDLPVGKPEYRLATSTVLQTHGIVSGEQ